MREPTFGPDPYIDAATRERADLRQATSAADAARRLLARRGFNIPSHVAEDLANAVLDHADQRVSVQDTADRHAWDIPAWRDDILQRLRRGLLDEITSHGCLPTALPTMIFTYTSYQFGVRVPLQGWEGEPPEWDQVLIKLSAPVRTPPIDRKAAVRAGLLNGQATTP